MSLENLDTLIGFTVVMLLLSLLVTTLVQLMGALLGLRGKNLFWGTQRVLKEIGIEENRLPALADQILNHESIRPNVLARFPNFLSRYASAIHFDEFWAILAKIPEAKGAPSNLPAKLQAEIADVATQARFWFDTVMARTTERFVLHTRIITVISAVALAFLAQIDSLGIIKQLSQRPEVRARLVALAEPVSKETATLVDAVDAPGAALPPASVTGGKEQVERLLAQVGTVEKELARTSLQLIPSPFTYVDYGQRLFGMFMTALFLSLGAPFWFNTLNQLANLRPILARKVDERDQSRPADAK